MKRSDILKEVVNQFIDTFSELHYDDISLRYYLQPEDAIFISKETRRIIRFSVRDVDFIDVLICKPKYSWSSMDPDKDYRKYHFYLYQIIKYFPENNLMQYMYKIFQYYLQPIEDYEELLKQSKSYSTEEERWEALKKTVGEYILFLKENLMPVISGEMWIDELLKQRPSI